MTKQKKSPPTTLRLRAETRLRTREATENAQRQLHELQVHQVELELQNEELRSTRAQAESLLTRYTDLYDFAPVGYFTISRAGLITQTNLTGSRMLGLPRARLTVFSPNPTPPEISIVARPRARATASRICAVDILSTRIVSAPAASASST